VGKTTTREPNILSLRGVSTCALKKDPGPRKKSREIEDDEGCEIYTVYVKFIRFNPDRLFSIWPSQKSIANDVHNARIIGRKQGGKCIRIHLSSFSIGLVQDILLLETKSSFLTSFSKRG
jgi:hypothetical protein